MALNFPNSPGIGSVYTDTVSGFSYEWDGTVWKSYSPASSSQIKILDDISGSFNGIGKTFAITSNSVSLTPANAQSLIVNLGGVVQDPTDDYSVVGTNIIFSDAPTSGLTFSGVSLGPAVPITTILDGTTTQGSLNVVGVLSAANLIVSGVSTFQSDIKLGDNDKAIFGDGNDLEILHDGSNSIIKDVGSGNLVIAGDGAVDIYNSTISEVRARFLNNSAVELYYDNSKEFETTGYGATVFGILQSQGLQVSGVSTFTGNPVLIGSATSTGTASQRLQVTGGGYVSGSVGIATTNPTQALHVVGNALITGNITGAAATFTNLTVNGTQTIINTTSLEIADKTVGIASTATPTDSYANGAGIVVYGTTNKTLTWDNGNSRMAFSTNVYAPRFFGDGSGLSGVSAGLELKQAGSSVGTAVTQINFASGATLTTASSGVSTITIAAGITTTASSPSANTVVTLNLSSAQHHELTLTAGITTITCSGGSFGDSHSVVLIQPSSGIATVGFSTYFLFPSGSSPVLSQGSSKFDLISFVVKRVGAAGTQLLASAGLDYQ